MAAPAPLNYRGVARTALLTRILVACTLSALVVLVVGVMSGGLHPANLGPATAWWSGGVYGILQSAGLLFVAFAGYARMVHPRHRVPHHAELVLAVVVSVLVLTADLRGVSGFSSFGVLVYYAIANASAFTQPRDRRRWPRGLNILGLTGCLILVATLPATSVLAGLVMFAIGLLTRIVVLGRRHRHRHHTGVTDVGSAQTARPPT